MHGAQVAVGSHVSKSPLLLGCEGCSRVLRHEGTVPAGGLAGTGASSLEVTHADVDPDPGPWPRADEETYAHSTSAHPLALQPGAGALKSVGQPLASSRLPEWS